MGKSLALCMGCSFTRAVFHLSSSSTISGYSHACFKVCLSLPLCTHIVCVCVCECMDPVLHRSQALNEQTNHM